MTSPEVIDQLMGIDMDGKIYPLEGEDLSAYDKGETDSTIWARISSIMLGPLLHCKYPTLIDQLSSTCAITCDTSC